MRKILSILCTTIIFISCNEKLETEKEREKLLIRQREAYEQLEVDSKGRKISKKKNKVLGRPNKIENLTTEQKRYIKAWIDGSIKISDCIKNTGIKKTSLYTIKKIFFLRKMEDS